MEDAGRRAVSEPAAVTAERPLNPHQRQAKEEQRDQIGNHKSPAAVDSGLGRKPEKISQPDGRTGHRHDDPQTGTPRISDLRHLGYRARLEFFKS